MMTKICPACGAEVPIGDLECGFCGSKIIPVALSFEQREEVTQLISELNKSMLKEKKKLVRQVDLVSTAVWLGGIVSIWIAGILLDSNSLKTGMLIFSALVLLLWRFYRRRRLVNEMIHFFRVDVEQQIDQVISRLMLPRWQFDQLAARELSENDPLRKFMFFRSQERKD